MGWQILNLIIVIFFGLAIGSFLNVIILRFEELKTIFTVRSHCPKCKKEIVWFDLIPFFSYIVLWGKCRFCKKSISIQYPLVEMGTALIFAALFWKFGLTLEFFVYLVISSILIVIFTYDILHQLIADILVWIALAIWVLWLAINYFVFDSSYFIALNSLYGGLISGGFLAILVVVSKEKWMGSGDIKLGILLGAMVSFPVVLVAMFSAFILGSIISSILIGFHVKSLKDQIPFAPFLISGMWIALFLGSQILNFYLGFY